jgi:uncharacterized OsmC-like protein
MQEFSSIRTDDMSEPIVVTHNGGMRFSAQVRSHVVATDQIERVGGTDTAPSPIELLGASLGSCIAFYVQQFCESRRLPYEGMRVEVEQLNAKGPARVWKFVARVVMPSALPKGYSEILERVVRSCPAHNTLSGGAQVEIDLKIPSSQTLLSDV